MKDHSPTATMAHSPFAVRDRISGPVASAIAVAALVVLVVTSAIAWDGTVPEWEADALRFVNDWPDWLEPIMWTLQLVGVLASPLLGGIAIAWAARRWEYVIPFALLTPLKLIIERSVLKQIVERERPFVSVGAEIHVRGTAFEGLSFPSGHVTTAVAFAILVVAFLPPGWRPLPLIWAVIVGIARLYFGEHNLLDVIAGAAMGTLFGTLLWITILNGFVLDNHNSHDSGPP